MTKRSLWGNYLSDYGYFNVSNLLIDYQEELNLSDDELIFIIKLSRYSNGWIIKNNMIDENLSSRTFQRRRKSLKEKGYLIVKENKYRNADGTFRTVGLIYDLSGLNKALQELFLKLEEGETNSKNSVKEELTEDTEKKIDAAANDPKIKEELVKECVETFSFEYAQACKNKDIRMLSNNTWFLHDQYKVSQKDIENLNKLSIDELKIMTKSLKALAEYLSHVISNGRFSNYDGKEMTPTISLFSVSRTQFTNLYDWYQILMERGESL